MNSFGKIIILIILNVLVSVSATLGVLYYWENIRMSEKPYQLITQPNQPSTQQSIDYDIVPSATPIPDIPTQLAQQSVIIPNPTADIPPVKDSRVAIIAIENAGVAARETVRIQTNSDTAVLLENWTLTDSNGNSFTFPNIQMLKKGFFIELYTRNGHTTPLELYWGNLDPIWQSGETAVLRDAQGNMQSSFRVP